MNTNVHFDTMSGPQKAAAVLVSISPEILKKIFKNFTDSERRAFSYHMATLGSIPSDQLQLVLRQFMTEFDGDLGAYGTFDHVHFEV